MRNEKLFPAQFQASTSPHIIVISHLHYIRPLYHSTREMSIARLEFIEFPEKAIVPERNVLEKFFGPRGSMAGEGLHGEF